MIDEVKKLSENNSEDNSGDAVFDQKQNGKKTVIKKTGAYAETEIIEDGKPVSKNSKKNSQNESGSSIDGFQLGPEMGAALETAKVIGVEKNNDEVGSASKRLKARMLSFLRGSEKEGIKIKGEYKGDVSINDVKADKEPFEERLKQSKEQAENLEKTIENNANKNAVVRRILAKYEEKIERDPKLAEKLDSKAEVIAKVGHVPASQMSHVAKLVEKAKEVQGKGPFDF